MKFSKDDEVIVNAPSYPDRDKLGFECIKLPDGQCIHSNNVLIVDHVVDDQNVKCVFKKFRDDDPLRECIIPAKYLKHSAKNLGVGSKVQFIPNVRCVQSGKVGRILKIDPSGIYYFEPDTKMGTSYECKSYELIDYNDLVVMNNFSQRIKKYFSSSEPTIQDTIRNHIVKSFEGSKINGEQVWIPKGVIGDSGINTDYWKINLYGPDCEGCINITYDGYRGWDPVAVDREDFLDKVVECIKNFIASVSSISLKNFSARLRKCFSKYEPYTQTYEVSVALDISKHPEMDPKSHQADENLPESLVDDLTSIGVKCNKSGFGGDGSYTILEFDVEREPMDRYSEITKFVTDKLVEYGFDKDRINITKWD